MNLFILVTGSRDEYSETRIRSGLESAYSYLKKECGNISKETILLVHGAARGASAGTHTGPGALDIGAAGLSKTQRVAAVHALKNAGFAAWYRRSVPGLWGPHIHCVAFGEKCAPGAQAQKGSYDRHRDGLAGDGYDKTYRPNPKVKWGYLRKRPVRRK